MTMRLMTALLFGVASNDPLTLTANAVFLLGVTAVASFIPRTVPRA